MAHTTIIGIDVSKNFADACAISAQGEVMLETKIFYDTVGLQHFLKQLDQLAGEQRHCAVAVMESTAHYHRILETYLRRSGIDVVVINPLQSGSMKNLEIRKIKNDRTDAKRIAQLYLFKMLRGNAVDSILVGSGFSWVPQGLFQLAYKVCLGCSCPLPWAGGDMRRKPH